MLLWGVEGSQQADLQRGTVSAHLFSPEHSSIRSLDILQLAPWKHCCLHQLQASWQLDAEAA